MNRLALAILWRLVVIIVGCSASSFVFVLACFVFSNWHVSLCPPFPICFLWLSTPAYYARL